MATDVIDVPRAGVQSARDFIQLLLQYDYMAYDKYDYDRETDYSSGKNPRMEDGEYNGTGNSPAHSSTTTKYDRRMQTMAILGIIALVLLANFFFNSVV